MQNEILDKHVSFRRGKPQSDSLDALSTKLKSELMPVIKHWEQCLGEQINKHPQLALGVGLLSGVALGWWVKR
ncbi:hypothetical protein [Gimesia aquarii]|uniref:DUF883 domain-containing protein n=1 Tax=Gimesia aquarii TaxID=2527964 RepID=A0A517WX26_9PLAN|nr:hypothetical protein [Gimesia aquarii]QDU09820.1 hypothetical protein V202x_32170 [Gimesia aquarii]